MNSIKTVFDHSYNVTSALFSNNNTLLATTDDNFKINIYDTNTRKLISSLDTSNNDIPYNLVFSSDDQLLKIISNIGHIYIYNLVEGFFSDNWLADPGSDKQTTILSNDGKYLTYVKKSVWGSNETDALGNKGIYSTLFYDISNKKQSKLILSNNIYLHLSLFSNDNKLFASADRSGKVQIYDLSYNTNNDISRNPNRSYRPILNYGNISCMAISDNNEKLVVAKDPPLLTIHDLSSSIIGLSYNKVNPVEITIEHPIDCMSFSYDNTLLATANTAHKIIIYNLSSNTKLYEFKNSNIVKKINTISFSKDNNLLATSDNNFKSTIFNLNNFNNSTKMTTLAKENRETLEYASSTLKNTKSFFDGINEYGEILQYASDNLQNNKNFVLENVRKNGLQIKYASVGMKDNQEVVNAAVIKTFSALKEAGDIGKIEYITFRETNKVTNDQNLMREAQRNSLQTRMDNHRNNSVSEIRSANSARSSGETVLRTHTNNSINSLRTELKNHVNATLEGKRLKEIIRDEPVILRSTADSTVANDKNNREIFLATTPTGSILIYDRDREYKTSTINSNGTLKSGITKYEPPVFSGRINNSINNKISNNNKISDNNKISSNNKTVTLLNKSDIFNKNFLFLMH